jgi:hypothetical protein
VDYINLLWGKGSEARLKSNNVLVVYYEDIVSNPRTSIEEIVNFLALPFEEGLLNIQESSLELPEFKSGEKYWYTKEQLKNEIRTDAVDRWRSILTDYDLYVIDRRLQRISGLTDRYQFEVNKSLRWALNDFFGMNLECLRRFMMRAFAKLSRIL